MNDEFMSGRESVMCLCDICEMWILSWIMDSIYMERDLKVN